jgi:DNA-binding NarL/FixJ family response regulator
MDYMLPTETTIDWIPSIREKFPDAKIVVMTGYAEIDILLRAMRVGVMDFILKPIETALLKYSLQRVSQILSHEQEIQSLLLDLQKSNELLNKQKAEYQFLNERLLETNRAFSTLAQNLDLEKKEIERQIGVKIKNNILPLVAKLQTDAKYNLEVDMLYQILWELASGITSPNSSLGILSTAELRVASLIERGLTNEEIAEKLCISLDTVKTHRKHIRKKMKITNSSVNLKSLLMDRFFNESRSQ